MQGKSKGGRQIRRERVAPGIWRRMGADGKPVFEVAYRDSDGRQRRETVHGGKRAAETRLAEIRFGKGRGQRVAPSPRLVFGEAAERWFSSAKVGLRPATVEIYRYALDVHVLPTFGRLRLDHIGVDQVATFIERAQTPEYRRQVEERVGSRATNAGEGYSASTIENCLKVIRQVFEHAERRLGWAGANPVAKLRKRERPRHKRTDRRILSRDEQSRLIAAATEPDRTIIATALGLGTRLGETLGLTWRDVDLEAGTIAVEFQVDRRGERVELKTKRSRRTIEAPGSVLAMLRQHKMQSRYSKPDDLVFASSTGRPLSHSNVAQRGLKRAVKRAQLDSPAPNFHSLRHTHASQWIAAGSDVVELSARLGHQTPNVTMTVYSHEFEAVRRSADRRARLDAIYGADAPAVSAGEPGEVVKLTASK